MKSKEVIPQEDGTITDHELNRVLGRYLGDNPIAGKATIFAYAFRLGQQFASKPPAQGYADSVEFEDYMGSERDNFVNEINNQKWDTKMRTAAESLLICFDQMANRLAGYAAHPPAPAGMEEAVMIEAIQYALNLIDLWGAGQYGTVSADHEGEMQALKNMELKLRSALSPSAPPAKEQWVKIEEGGKMPEEGQQIICENNVGNVWRTQFYGFADFVIRWMPYTPPTT